MQAQELARYQSIEAVDPTVLVFHPDRLEITRGTGAQKEIPVGEIAKVKLRTLLGVSTLVLKLRAGRPIVVDLLEPGVGREVAELIEELRSGLDAAA